MPPSPYLSLPLFIASLFLFSLTPTPTPSHTHTHIHIHSSPPSSLFLSRTPYRLTFSNFPSPYTHTCTHTYTHTHMLTSDGFVGIRRNEKQQQHKRQINRQKRSGGFSVLHESSQIIVVLGINLLWELSVTLSEESQPQHGKSRKQSWLLAFCKKIKTHKREKKKRKRTL